MSKRRLLLNENQLDISGGGTALDVDIVNALEGASSPSSSNVFSTMKETYRTAWVKNTSFPFSSTDRIRNVTKGSTKLFPFAAWSPLTFTTPDFTNGGIYPLQNGVYRGKIAISLYKFTAGNLAVDGSSICRLLLGTYRTPSNVFVSDYSLNLMPLINASLTIDPTIKYYAVYIDFILSGFSSTSNTVQCTSTFNVSFYEGFDIDTSVFTGRLKQLSNDLIKLRIAGPNAFSPSEERYLDGFVETNINFDSNFIEGSYCEATDY